MKKFIVFILTMAFLLTGNTIFAEKTQTYLKGSFGLLSAFFARIVAGKKPGRKSRM